MSVENLLCTVDQSKNKQTEKSCDFGPDSANENQKKKIMTLPAVKRNSRITPILNSLPSIYTLYISAWNCAYICIKTFSNSC